MAKIIVKEESGEMCGCGSRYALTHYGDGSIRYEFTQTINGLSYMTEWRTVRDWTELEAAWNAYDAAWHGDRH